MNTNHSLNNSAKFNLANFFALFRQHLIDSEMMSKVEFGDLIIQCLVILQDDLSLDEIARCQFYLVHILSYHNRIAMCLHDAYIDLKNL